MQRSMSVRWLISGEHRLDLRLFEVFPKHMCELGQSTWLLTDGSLPQQPCCASRLSVNASKVGQSNGVLRALL
eukprot:3288284-Amphidinium_carterae.1